MRRKNFLLKMLSYKKILLVQVVCSLQINEIWSKTFLHLNSSVRRKVKQTKKKKMRKMTNTVVFHENFFFIHEIILNLINCIINKSDIFQLPYILTIIIYQLGDECKFSTLKIYPTICFFFFWKNFNISLKNVLIFFVLSKTLTASWKKYFANMKKSGK